jgi:hypothetical protein
VTQLLLQHHFGKFSSCLSSVFVQFHLLTSCISSETRYSRGVETPVHPSQTPLNPIQTPMRDPGGVFLHALLWFV